MKTSVLYLIPNTLGPAEPSLSLPQGIFPIIHSLRFFFVENERNARRFLIRTGMPVPIDELRFYPLDKNSPPEEIEACLEVLRSGNDAGIISEAGMPAIADPGAPLVRLAHLHGIRVKPLTGPSSVSLALAASGMNGQQFAFRGYLPIPQKEREQVIRDLERESEEKDLTQVFMETPYRNHALIEILLKTCRPDTLLCLAADLTLESEFIKTRTVEEWKKQTPDLHKRPAIFLIYRGKGDRQVKKKDKR